MKKLRMLSGLCVAGMLMVTGIAGCSNETKSNANQQESQKERDMKEADKAAVEYLKAYIEMDSNKINDLLNDLDWWVSSQWETFETRHTYSRIGKKYRALRDSSDMKEMFIVRYADDFKIFTRNYETAIRAFQGGKKYLNAHLKLNCAKDKSKITNIRKKGSDFLGFKIKARKTRGKYVADTYVSDKAKENINKNLKELIKLIGKTNNARNITRFNLYVLGIQNYYRCAT